MAVGRLRLSVMVKTCHNYSEFLDNQTAITSLEYTKRAVQWFARPRNPIQEIMTDFGGIDIL